MDMYLFILEKILHFLAGIRKVCYKGEVNVPLTLICPECQVLWMSKAGYECWCCGDQGVPYGDWWKVHVQPFMDPKPGRVEAY